MGTVETPVLVNSWISMDWSEYLRHLEDPQFEKAKAYYYQGYGRFEMLPVGFGHGDNHVVTTYALNLFCALKTIPLRMVDNTTLRKAGLDDCQPDLSIWLGPTTRTIPMTTGIVDLDQYPSPNIVVEISNTSLLDDLGTKRSLYEDLDVSEYWIVDVRKGIVLAFEMLNRGSQRIEISHSLPGFEFSVLEEALRLSSDTDQAQMGAWLLKQLQK